jgi:hypothetical protein
MPETKRGEAAAAELTVVRQDDFEFRLWGHGVL